MFNDKFGLTQAVLEGRKTMTRRIVKGEIPLGNWEETEKYATYKIGEVVAIAQSYRDIYLDSSSIYKIGLLGRTAGWRNKMFVSADDMPHHIKITNIRVEYLQEISNEDCMREGVYFDKERGRSIGYPLAVPFYYTFRGAINRDGKQLHWSTPKDAFAVLIDKVSGRGTWDSNPLVWVYEFELVD